MSRPPYLSLLYCIKCGTHQQHFGTQFHGFREFGGDYCEQWLLRTCQLCGFEWEEACLDAPTL